MNGRGLILCAGVLMLLASAPSCKKDRDKRIPPHIDSLTRLTDRPYPPDQGLEGDVVRIDGSGFSGVAVANTVTFNGVQATVLLARGNQITVTVPVGARTGPVQVTVGGLQSNEVTFTILTLPTIAALIPDFGPLGTLVTIQGRYFGVLPVDNIITFDGVFTPTLTASQDELTCFVPPGAGTGDVTVEVASETSDPALFTVTTPRLDRVEAFFGVVGSAIVLSGENFSPDTAENIVRFAGIESPVLFSSSFGDSLSTTVPPGARSGPVTVEVTGGRGSSNGMPFCLDGTPPPGPGGIILQPGAGAVGDPVLISGSNFSTNPSDNEIRFNGTLAATLGAAPLALQAEVPPGAITGPVTVTVAGQTVSSMVPFTVTSPPPPLPGLIELIPNSGTEGEWVTIRGTDFSPEPSNNRVFFNGVEADVRGASPDGLLVRIPFASDGLVTVEVGGQASAGGLVFDIIGQAATGSTFSYFGRSLPAPSDSVVFVVDISGTTAWTYGTFIDRFGNTITNGTRLDLMKDRTAAAINALPGGFTFDVVAFDCASLIWSGAMMQATATNKNSAINFVMSLLPSGSSDTGFGGATALGIDTSNRAVTLVSDGLPTCGPTSPASHLCEILTANTQNAQVHAISIQGFGDFRVLMQDLASLTGGTFIDVP